MSRTMARSYRNNRSEPFELLTRPQRSKPARVLGLLIRRRAELTLIVAGLWVWSWLADRMPAWVVVVLLGLLVQGLVWFGPTRRFLWHRALAVVTRHRLRAVFVERRIMNYSGNLPMLLWSHPTAVGERVLVLLRAGIDLVDFEANLAYLASGCLARTARASAVTWMTAFVLVDIVRRDPLATEAVPSSLATDPPRPPLQLVPTLEPPAVEQGA